MADHIKLIGIIINFIIGFSLMSYIYHIARNYFFSFNKLLLLHVTCINLLLLMLFLAKYLEINVFSNISGKVVILDEIACYFLYVLFIGLSYSMFGIFFGFSQKRMPFLIKKLSIILLCVASLTSIMVAVLNNAIIYNWYNVFYNNFAVLLIVVGFIIIEPIILIKILLISNGKIDSKEIRLYKIFSLLYLSRYFFILVCYLFAYDILRLTIIILYMNLIPFIWLRFYFIPYFKNRSLIDSDKLILDILYRKNNISDREKEIIKMILGGMTNKEICDSLFISIRTVKNHIYNIYKKMNINSRYQLINTFMNHKNDMKKI